MYGNKSNLDVVEVERLTMKLLIQKIYSAINKNNRLGFL